VDVGVQTSRVLRDPPTKPKEKSTQTVGDPVCAPHGITPVKSVEVGIQASCGSREVPKRRRKRRRRKRCDASAYPPPTIVKGTGGGDMAPAGAPVGEGRAPGKLRDVRALAPSRSSVNGPTFAAVAAAPPGARRLSHFATSAGGAGDRGVREKIAPAAGSVLRSGCSSPPPPRKPEVKETRPLPSKAEAEKTRSGMRGIASSSSVPGETQCLALDRDVTVERLFSAVSLLRNCGLGGMVLRPARRVAAPPLSAPIPGPVNRERVGRDAKCKDGQRGVYPRKPSQRSPPVGGNKVCWGCGAAGHFLRGCLQSRRMCRGYGRAQAAGGAGAAAESRAVTDSRRSAGRGTMESPATPARRRPGTTGARTAATNKSPQGARPAPASKDRSLGEPTPGGKGADPSKPAGAPYRGPRGEKDPAPTVVRALSAQR